MPSNNPNRKPAREQLATLLRARLQTTNNFVDGMLVAKVYEYLVWDFKEGLPVVCVHSVSNGGSERRSLAFNPTRFEDNWFYFEITSIMDVASEDGTWTEKHAQDRMDDIEKTVADVLVDNKISKPYWSDLSINGKSTPSVIEIDGNGYLIEAIPVKAQVIR